LIATIIAIIWFIVFVIVLAVIFPYDRFRTKKYTFDDKDYLVIKNERKERNKKKP